MLFFRSAIDQMQVSDNEDSNCNYNQDYRSNPSNPSYTSNPSNPSYTSNHSNTDDDRGSVDQGTYIQLNE